MVYVVVVIDDERKPHISAVYYCEERAREQAEELNDRPGTVAWVEESYLIQ